MAYRYNDSRNVKIAGQRYRQGDTIEGVALQLALRFGHALIEVAADEVARRAPQAIKAAEDWAARTYAEIKEAAEAAGYSGDSKAKTALLEFLEGLEPEDAEDADGD